MVIILVHIGNELPTYIHTCIEQIKRVAHADVLLVHSENIKDVPKGVDTIHYEEVRNYGAMAKFNSLDYFDEWTHRGEPFWKYACERLFVVEAAMDAVFIDRAMHIENDNLVYARPDVDYLYKTIGGKIGLTAINEELLSAGIMYVGSLDSLRIFNESMIRLLEQGEQELMRKYGGVMMHEMRMMKIASMEPDSPIRMLPIFPDESSKFVYDCASWGQYVGGVHHGDGSKFAHNSHFIGREIINKRYDVRWTIDGELKVPAIIDWKDKSKSGKMIYNLHIHSKNLEGWKSW